jgi:hypothetical protein
MTIPLPGRIMSLLLSIDHSISNRREEERSHSLAFAIWSEAAGWVFVELGEESAVGGIDLVNVCVSNKPLLFVEDGTGVLASIGGAHAVNQYVRNTIIKQRKLPFGFIRNPLYLG